MPHHHSDLPQTSSNPRDSAASNYGDTHWSPAQNAPEDILDLIFSDAPPISAKRSAEVCRNWYRPCQRQLYGRLNFDVTKSWSVSLAATLKSSATIRGIIRSLAIYHGAAGAPYSKLSSQQHPSSLYDWIPLLPSFGIHSLHIYGVAPDEAFQMALRRCPALPSLRHIGVIVRWDCLFPSIETHVSLPLLESLCINIERDGWNPPLDLHIPALRSLFVDAGTSGFDSRLSGFLALAPSTLTRLELLLGYLHTEQTPLSAMQETLLRFPSLQRLAIKASTIVQLRLLDDVVPWLPELSYLACSDGLYSSKMLLELPSNVRFIHLGASRAKTFPLSATITMLERAQHGTLLLKEMVFAGLAWVEKGAAAAQLLESCRSAGIVCTFMPVELEPDWPVHR